MGSHYKINPPLLCTDCDRLYRQTGRQIGFFFTFLNKKKLYKNSPKILTQFQKTVDDGLNPPVGEVYGV